MARTLTPLSEKRITEYRKKISNAYKLNDKAELKRWKHLFLGYIKRQGKTLEDFENDSIYKFFTEKRKPKRIDVLKRQITSLENYIENKYILKGFNVKNKYKIEALKSRLNDEAKSFVNNVIKDIEERIIERHIRYYTYRDKKENERLFYDRTDISLLIHLIEQLKKYKRKWIIEYKSIDDPADKIYKKILKTKEKALEYLQNKKYKMREYRLRQYIIKRFNEDTQDDLTDIINYYFSNDMDNKEKESNLGKENIDFLKENIEKYTAEYKKQRNVKTDKQKKE